MALLGYAGGGRLGNFGDVGVDQATFAPAVFLWFVGIGALTVAMSGGIAPTAQGGRSRCPNPSAEPEPASRARADEDDAEPDARGRPSTPKPNRTSRSADRARARGRAGPRGAAAIESAA